MPNQSAAVVLQDLGFEFAQGRRLFKNLNYSFHRGTTALVGANGVGKTTLAELIAGLLDPSEGSIQRFGEVIMLKQIEARPALTVNEYLIDIWDDPNGGSAPWLSLIENIPENQELKTLSGGEWTRVRLVKALSRSPVLLILDEPTNNLDSAARERIYSFIQEYTSPLLIISHDRRVLKIVNKLVELSNLGLKVYGGNYDFYLEEKEAEEVKLNHRIESAKAEKSKTARLKVEKVSDQEARNKKAHKESLKGGMPRILRGALKRKAQVTLGKVQVQSTQAYSESVEKLKDLQSMRKVRPDFALDFENLKLAEGKLVFDLKDFNLAYSHDTHWLWKENLNWIVRGPRRWALTGKNGSGKSTLIRSILGIETSLQRFGSQTLGSVQTAVLDQDYSLLNSEMSILENILEVTDIGAEEIRNKLARFQFTEEKSLRPVKFLSGGEKLKAALALILLNKNPVDFLILDEPTNNLDLDSLEILTAAIEHFKGALLVVSHDDVFLQNLRLDGVINLAGPGFAIA